MTTDDCKAADLPTQCEHRFTIIETKLDRVLEGQKTTSRRAWDIVKGFILIVAGIVIASFRGGK